MIQLEKKEKKSKQYVHLSSSLTAVVGELPTLSMGAKHVYYSYLTLKANAAFHTGLFQSCKRYPFFLINDCVP